MTTKTFRERDPEVCWLNFSLPREQWYLQGDKGAMNEGLVRWRHTEGQQCHQEGQPFNGSKKKKKKEAQYQHDYYCYYI